MSDNKPPQTSLWFGMVFMLAGAIIMLVAVDVIHADESSFNAPRWVVGVSGLVFFLGGIAASLQDFRFDTFREAWWFRAAVNLAPFGIILSFAAVANWIAFGPGERNFSGSISIPFITISGANSDEFLGRAVFGLSAICMNVLVVVILVRGLRTLLRGERLDEERDD